MADAFSLPFAEAIEYFLGKVPLSSDQVAALAGEAKDRAFWVSGMADESITEALYGQVYKALATGQTFNTFKKEMAAKFQELGYAPLNPHRLKTIFENNINPAYSAGHYKQRTTPAVLKARPYWEYLTMGDSRVRPAHAALHGRVWPADDPWWSTGTPPNDYGCRCTVRTLSEAEVKARGVEVERSSGGTIKYEPIDPETGQRSPAREFKVAKGWDFNPGQVAWGRPPALRAAESRYSGGWQDLSPAGNPGPLFDSRPAPVDRGRRVNTAPEMEAYLEEVIGGKQRVIKDATGRPVLATIDLAKHLSEQGGRGPYLPLLPHTIQDPAEIWLQAMKSERSGRVALRRVYLARYQFEGGRERSVVTVAERQHGAWVGWTTYPQDKASKLTKVRRGIRIYERH